jgi:hypothetical protein
MHYKDSTNMTISRATLLRRMRAMGYVFVSGWAKKDRAPVIQDELDLSDPEIEKARAIKPSRGNPNFVRKKDVIS